MNCKHDRHWQIYSYYHLAREFLIFGKMKGTQMYCRVNTEWLILTIETDFVFGWNPVYNVSLCDNTSWQFTNRKNQSTHATRWTLYDFLSCMIN